MRKISLLLVCCIFSYSVNATEIIGQLRIQGSFFGSSAQLTGDIDVGNNTLQLDPSTIFGATTTFQAVELLTPGTYTRMHNLAAGGTISRTETIPAGKSGVYFVVTANATEYQIFDAWTVTSGGLNYASINFSGNVMIGGSLNGIRIHTDFSTTAPPPPALTTSITVDGGLTQECAQLGGTNVTANATVVASNGAILDRIEWTFDGVFIGSGASVSFFSPLGGTPLLATSFGSDGFTTGAHLVSVVINDTTRPSLQVQFLDNQGAVVSSAPMGAYQIHFEVSDICDPSPMASGTATPVMSVVEGDTIQINSSIDVQLPTTAVRVDGTAVDASGRTTFNQGILLVE